ncbi:hypothetical protein EVAR_98507_1 [Eumeta japonica]|uniref:Uncharacterized protein n=1 Tax=Eumeta variegata TaxID=151549 RepID=A0A4C2AF00_EUMVA|nr:hypothetical protein EVAR_98507_1 [Eumeta japonica]
MCVDFCPTDSASVVVHVVSGERPAAMQSSSERIYSSAPFLLFSIVTNFKPTSTFIVSTGLDFTPSRTVGDGAVRRGLRDARTRVTRVAGEGHSISARSIERR